MKYDFYVVGDVTGFYAGQAKHLPKGGYERRLREHRKGGRSGSRAARELLLRGAPVICIGTVICTPIVAHFFEARAWDVRVAAGWKPVHPRPCDSPRWCPAPTAQSRAKQSAALRGRPKPEGFGRRISQAKLGHSVSMETRQKLSAAHKTRDPASYTNQGAKLRGRPLSAEHRRKISASLRGRHRGPMTPEQRYALSAAMKEWHRKQGHRVYDMTRPPRLRRGSQELRALLRERFRGRVFSEESKAKMARAARNRSVTHREKLSKAQRRVWEQRLGAKDRRDRADAGREEDRGERIISTTVLLRPNFGVRVVVGVP